MHPYHLLVIDPQNDFMDVQGAALPVPGASSDMTRLARWLLGHLDEVQHITITLDSHPSVAVERTSFWLKADGTEVAPFTVISAQDMAAGHYVPRHASIHKGLVSEVLRYLHALETTSQRQLVVWPVHCVLGTWGHNIYPALADAVAAWEAHTGRLSRKVLKGQNPLTEQYSAFKAEVPRADDPRTQLNLDLIRAIATPDTTLLIAGEALSHCVAASVQDLMLNMPGEHLRQTIVLTDCMSPVPGFEAMGEAFLDGARAAGVATQTLRDLGWRESGLQPLL